MKRTAVLISYVAAVGLAAGVAFVWYQRTIDTACNRGAVAGGAGEIGGPFTLVSETGEIVTDTDLIDRPTLIYFGYTFCPDICPIDTSRNAEAIDLLKAQGYDVRAAMISVDPERDSPEVMAEYTDYVHEDMIGLTGSLEQVAEAAKAYKVYYRKMDSDDEYYLVDHTGFTYLMLPETGFADLFRRDVKAAEMADRAACIIDESR